MSNQNGNAETGNGSLGTEKHLNGVSKHLDSERIRVTLQLIEMHTPQLVSSGIPELYWPFLFEKLQNEIFDAGYYFQMRQRVDEDDNLLGYKAVCVREEGLGLDEPYGVFLIDHSWTYRLNEARQGLRENEALIKRLCTMMCIEVPEVESDQKFSEVQREELIENIMTEMWRFNQTYKLSSERPTDEEREPIWYVMDEFGSSIRHNDDPTVNIVPFCYLPTKTMYSILWPVKALAFGDELTRDYAYKIKDETMRKAKLLPWFDDEEEEEEVTGELYVKQEEPPVSYFNSGREDELYCENLKNQEASGDAAAYFREKLSLKRKLAVYTDFEALKPHLDEAKYEFVDDQSQADIIFMRKHFKDFKGLHEKSPTTLLNQFPFENVVTVKDLLAIVCRRNPDWKLWLPITYNLTYELPMFIQYYKRRRDAGLDNHWILKPWNLARSIDTTITNNLSQIIRSQETGPKIACKYIKDPVLFYREELNGSVKFDIRYIVLLRSLKPLTIFTYNVFWLRFSNKPYSLDNLDDYEKHFTVMNYRPVNLKQINCDEFVPMFEQQYSDYKWSGIQDKIFKMIRKVFEGATLEEPPKGMGNNPQSRAMYAIDLMLDWRQEGSTKIMEPMICEINFMPDCTRACKFHPYFFNDVFDTLFLDNLEHNRVTKI